MIQVKSVVKQYKDVRAVDGISLEVKTGDVFGVIGHNGAGKTTLIKLLSGQIQPTSGHVEIDGQDVTDDIDIIKVNVGLVGDVQNLYDRLSGRENLLFFARLYGLPALEKRVGTLLDQANLSSVSKRPVGTYSLGMRQQLLIARALLHSPRYLFLDEPMRGLDPVASENIKQLLIGLSGEGTTIFLTTHYMPDVEMLCDRVAFLNQGKIMATGKVSDLRKRFGKPNLVTVELNTGETKIIDLGNVLERSLLEQAIRENHVASLHTREASIQEIYIELYGSLGA